MLYPGGCGPAWHVGCNYMVTRTTKSLRFKKRRHGSDGSSTGSDDCGYRVRKKNASSSSTHKSKRPKETPQQRGFFCLSLAVLFAGRGNGDFAGYFSGFAFRL
jgi:hypothetical protein